MLKLLVFKGIDIITFCMLGMCRGCVTFFSFPSSGPGPGNSCCVRNVDRDRDIQRNNKDKLLTYEAL